MLFLAISVAVWVTMTVVFIGTAPVATQIANLDAKNGLSFRQPRRLSPKEGWTPTTTATTTRQVALKDSGLNINDDHIIREYFRNLRIPVEKDGNLSLSLLNVWREHNWPPKHLVENIADDQNRVLIASPNCGFVDFADNWVGGLMRFNRTNYLLVPMDWKAHDIMVSAYGAEHVLPPMPGVNFAVGETNYTSDQAFSSMTKRRPMWLLEILNAGDGKNISLFYMDVDTVWVKDALTDLEEEDRNDKHPHYDFQLCSRDNLVKAHVRNFNSGMIYMKSTQGTRTFLNGWAKTAVEYKRAHDDQEAMQHFLFNEVGVRVKNCTRMIPKGILWFEGRIPVNTHIKYPHGVEYFERQTNRSEAVIVHNNFITGGTNKRKRFRDHGLWNPTGRLPSDLDLASMCRYE